MPEHIDQIVCIDWTSLNRGQILIASSFREQNLLQFLVASSENYSKSKISYVSLCGDTEMVLRIFITRLLEFFVIKGFLYSIDWDLSYLVRLGLREIPP